MPHDIDLPEAIDSLALKFLDLRGNVREICLPPNMYQVAYKDGIGFDSSNLSFAEVAESDMLIKPVPSTLRIVEIDERKAVSLCEIQKGDGTIFPGDPRYMLRNTLKELGEKGFTFHVKPEYEFHLLDPSTHAPIDEKDYIDGSTSTARILRELTQIIEQYDFQVEKVHHEVGKGQYEIEPLPYEDPLQAADDFIFIKKFVKKMARKKGYQATFMPKPIIDEPGNGFHIHVSVFKDGEYLFSPDKLNEEAKGFIGGLIQHAKALSAICSPTVNSYKRLIPGYEAPVYISWGGENRSVLVRIPEYGSSEEPKGRVEFRASDASANIYLLLNSLIQVGINGLEHSLDPGKEVSDNLYELRKEELEKRHIETLPRSLEEALAALATDETVKKTLGESYKHYQKAKREELHEYRTHISDWERKKYATY